MTSNIPNNAPYLPSSRSFPEDVLKFEQEITKTYIDIASMVNMREIGIYTPDPTVTGQQWFLPDKKQSLRKIFQFGAIGAGATLTLAHGLTGNFLITRRWGEVITNVVDYRPIPYADVANVTNQISFRNDATNIIIVNAATAPPITSGIAVLEYLFL